MNLECSRFRFHRRALHSVIGIACVASLSWSSLAQAQEAPQETTTEEAPRIPNEQLDSLVAPIALYPDDLLAQTLAASTYPLEVMQLDQWMDKNKNLKDKALVDAVAKQPWDPSVQSMAAFPDVVQRMAENIQWMTDVGNAVLAQQKDVMDAVQRMRAKAQGTGNLKTGSEQKVETKTTQGGQQAIVIEQANPEAVYVPSYDPEVVYGPAPAEAPYYPYSYPGYRPGTALAWGSAIAVGGAWANNNWGNCDWDNGDVNINNNNNFNKNYNKNVNKGAGQSNSWQHNPQHRGNAPYANKQTASKYGGKTAGGAGKPGGPGGAGGVGGAGKPGGPGGAGGVGGAGKPGGPGGAGGVGGAGKAGGPGGAGGVGGAGKPGGPGGAGGAGKPGGAGGAGSAGKPGGAGGAGKAGGGSAAKASGGGGKGSADKVGGHKPSGGGSGGAFAGGSGSSAKAASSRGGSSMKGGGGGGGKGGGGGGKKGGGGGGGKKGGGGGGRKR